MVMLAIAALAISQGAAQDGVKRLSFLEGNWESKETTQSPDGKPIDFTLAGTNKWILDGEYLQIDEAFEIPGAGKFSNHILMTFDKRDSVYRAWWYSSRSPRPTTFAGKWDEKGDLKLDDEAGRVRIVYHPLEPGHYTAQLLVKDGETYRERTVADYRRK